VTDLDGVPDGYGAMKDRQAIKMMFDFSWPDSGSEARRHHS
jgi:hypothetical protein